MTDLCRIFKSLRNGDTPLSDRISNIENGMTGWTDKKPLGGFLLFFKGGVKTVLVTTQRANFKLICQRYLMNLSVHNEPSH